MKKYLITLAASAAATAAQAAITITNSEAASFTVSSTDLLQTQFASYSGSNLADRTGSAADGAFLTGLPASGESSLRDGIWYDHDHVAAGTPASSASRGSALVENNEFSIFNFNLTTNTLGYDITGVDLYSNWGSGGGRDEINVTISLALVSTPTVFDQVVVTGETYNPPNETQAKMSIAGIEATGIAAIRFDWLDGQENNAVGYSELDVFGTATLIPEPSSSLLFGLGGLALTLRRRK